MKKKEVLRYILKQLKQYTSKMVIIVICMLIVASLGIISPLIQEKLFDDGIMAGDMSLVIKYTVCLMLFFFMQKVFEFIQFVQSEYINKQLPYQLLHDTIYHSLRLKIAYYKDNNFSKIINNTYKDISEITELVNTSIVQSLVSVFKIIGGVIGLILINWKLAVFVLAIVPIEIIISSLFSKKRQNLNKIMMKKYETFAVWLSETFNGIEILKLWNLQKKRQREFEEIQSEMIKTEKKIEYIDNYSDISSSTINMFFTYGLNLLGAFFIFGGELTIGGLFAFTSYSIYVMEPISILARIMYKISSSIPAFERFLEFFNNDVESEKGMTIPEAKQIVENIKFVNIVFGYDGKEPVLDKLSFTINKGEKVAFIGCNGSGKSTILQLLLRFFDPQSGEIFINGIDIQNFNLIDFRKLFCVMNQNLFLFEDSIKNNINVNNDLTDSEIEFYLELLNADKFIETLPEGINTRVGYNGTKLSGGEKQKVILARTLCRKAPILILDEATASFDIEAERQFDEYIRKTKQYEIIIVVSHRIDILKNMDKIFVLEKGRIVDIGTFEELEERNIDLISILDKEKNNECNN